MFYAYMYCDVIGITCFFFIVKIKAENILGCIGAESPLLVHDVLVFLAKCHGENVQVCYSENILD